MSGMSEVRVALPRERRHPAMESKTAYDAWHGEREVDEEADSPWHDLVRTKLDPSRDLEGKRVLEIGCGRGGFSVWLAGEAKIREQHAMDFSDAAVDKGRAFAERRGHRGIVWQRGDIQAIDRPSGFFDTVFSCETIEHVPEPKRAVSELVRVLKPGGRLFLTTPNYLGTLGLYRGYLRMRGRVFQEVGQPINKFTMLPLTLRWLRNAGLRVEHVDAIGHYLPFPGRPPIRIESLDGARKLTRWLALHSFVLAQKP